MSTERPKDAPAGPVPSEHATVPSWPLDRAGNALVALANAAGLPLRTSTPPRSIGKSATGYALGTWMEHAALSVGLEAEPLQSFYPDLDVHVSVSAPALFLVRADTSQPGLVALARLRGKRATILAPDGTMRTASLDDLRAALLEGLHVGLVTESKARLESLPLTPARRARALEALLRSRLGRRTVGRCWALRQPAGAPLRDLVRRRGWLSLFAGLLGLRTLELFASIAAWALLGRGALEGRFDFGWIWAWGLILLTQVPIRAVAGTLQGRLAIGFGGLLKQRLLLGSLQMDRDEIRHDGVGALFGRVLEAEAIGALGQSGGVAAIAGLLSAIAALVILSLGAAPVAECVILVAWLVFGGFAGWRMHGARARWTSGRLSLTHALVENIVGHRTRLAQGPRALHEEEDGALHAYVASSRVLDRRIITFRTLVPLSWFVTAFVGLGPAFTRGAPALDLAITVGGILLGYRALSHLTPALDAISTAVVAWDRVGRIVAKATLDETGAPAFVAKAGENTMENVLEVHDVTFRYRATDEPTLSHASLTIKKDDRILLEGPSGGGKSTFAALLAGLRQPESGLVLLRGLDHRTLGGHGWRTGVAFAPQFHENHVLSSTFGFNVLLGRQWPADPEDLDEAEAICAELDLGPLLDRMPSRMLQTVGDTGWQLSHGEKSRLYLARALLQRASLVVLDESFAALDPETMAKCVACARKRAAALLVIAHP